VPSFIFWGQKMELFLNPKFGTKTPFMSKDQTYQGLGLALLLLRLIQLYPCCLGKTPILIIQVEVATRLHAYLMTIGFKAATREKEISFIKKKEMELELWKVKKVMSFCTFCNSGSNCKTELLEAKSI
jgi:hypothetical protein